MPGVYHCGPRPLVDSARCYTDGSVASKDMGETITSLTITNKDYLLNYPEAIALAVLETSVKDAGSNVACVVDLMSRGLGAENPLNEQCVMRYILAWTTGDGPSPDRTQERSTLSSETLRPTTVLII